ncbi:hypothetical protein Dimus_001002, partial [Dionaea muscipula]
MADVEEKHRTHVSVLMSPLADGDRTGGSSEVFSSGVGCFDGDPCFSLNGDDGRLEMLQRGASVLLGDVGDSNNCLIEGDAGLGSGFADLE